MRFILLFLAIHIAALLTAQSNSADKLVAYFPFTKCNAIDDSGNNSSGAIIGDTLCVCGAEDNAMHFDTVKKVANSLLLVGPVTDVFTTSDFTVSFYIRPNFKPTGGTSQVVLSKQETCTTKNAFWVRYSTKNKKISSGISENDSLIAIVQADLDDDVCWQYITLVRSNTKYSLYVNGTLRDTKVSAGRINLTSNAPVKVSQPVCTNFDQNFFGDLDNLRFHNKALSQEDLNRYYSPPDKILNSDTLIYLGNSMQIRTSNTCANAILWSPTTGVSKIDTANPVITPQLPGFYIAEFAHPSGCRTHDTIHVNVIDPDTLDCNRVFIPNAFTPGSSLGRNDLFGISNPFSVDEFISFEVFDRWGGQVFSALTPFEAWDGTSQGEALNAGIFLYRLRYKCDGQEKVKSGTLTLLR